MPFADFLAKFKQQLRHCIWHDFEARWQTQQFHDCLATFPVGSVVVSLDFSQNHAFLYQLEPQSVHWNNSACSLLCMVLYRHARGQVDGVESTDSSRMVVKEHHIFMSDDLDKDTEFVYHCLTRLHDEGLLQRGLPCERLVLWSDGCGAQFKCAGAFWDHNILSAQCVMCVEHHYFASYHGKGEHDSAGAVVKHSASMWQNQHPGATMQNASGLFEFCCDQLSQRRPSTYPSRRDACSTLHGTPVLSERRFYLVGPADVQHKDKSVAKTLAGSRSMHALIFDGASQNTVQWRVLSCMCGGCWAGQWDECVNAQWVQAPVTAQLRTTHQRTEVTRRLVAREAVAAAACAAGNAGSVLPWEVQLAAAMEPAARESPPAVFGAWDKEAAAHFIVRAPDDDVQDCVYYLLRCVSKPYSLLACTRDGRGQQFARGTEVVEAQYFELQEGSSFSGRRYVLPTEAPTALIPTEYVLMVHVELQALPPAAGCKQQVYEVSLLQHEQAMGVVEHLMLCG
jgi:hypothetical protein